MSWQNDEVIGAASAPSGGGWQADEIVQQAPLGERARRVAEGVGRGATQAGFGVKEALDNAALYLDKTFGTPNVPGMPSPQEAAAATQGQIQEAKRLDQALLSTPEGKIGSVAGELAVAVPTMFIPGANSAAGMTLVGAAQGGLLRPGSAEERAQNALVGGVAGAGGYVVGKGIQAGASALANRAAAKTADGIAKGLPRDQALATARREGYVIPPTQVDNNANLFTRLMEGWSGKLSTQQAAATRNQEVTDTLARRALGIEGKGPLTASEIEAAKQPAFAVYKEVADLSPDAAEAVKLWRQANYNAQAQARYFERSLNPEAQAAAQAAKAEAAGWQKFLEEQAAAAGRPELIGQLQAARVQLAKVGTVENSWNEATGSVTAKKIAQAWQKGKPLTGDLESVARVATAYPKATAEVLESMPGVSPLDFGVGAGSIVAGEPTTAVGWMLGRPLVRNGLLSRPIQALTTAPSYAPNRLAQLAAQSLQNPVIPNALGFAAAQGAIQR